MAKTEQLTKTKRAPPQASSSVNGSRLDTSFIGQPHEWDPRRLYSQTGADWQYRVDFDRLRKERLAKLQEQMVAADLGALVLFAGANIRYATASYQGNWKYNINIRYAVVPNGGEPVLFETAGSGFPCTKCNFSWVGCPRPPAVNRSWVGSAAPHTPRRTVGTR